MDADNKFTVGNFYRPPHDHVNSLTLFIDYFSVTLSQYEQSRSTAYMCGDYNINLFKIFSEAHCNEFYEGIASSGFLPTITLPSRLSANSSIIDNILTNKQETVTFSAILLSHISDHQAVMIVTSQQNSRIRTKYITIYPNDDNSKKKFIEHFMQQNIYDSLSKDMSNDPNNNYNVLMDEKLQKA